MSDSGSVAEGDPVVVDARGLRCPVPVLQLAAAVAAARAGTVVTVLSDDAAAASDVPAWCEMKSVDYLGQQPADGGGVAYSVRRPAGR